MLKIFRLDRPLKLPASMVSKDSSDRLVAEINEYLKFSTDPFVDKLLVNFSYAEGFAGGMIVCSVRRWAVVFVYTIFILSFMLGSSIFLSGMHGDFSREEAYISLLIPFAALFISMSVLKFVLFRAARNAEQHLNQRAE